MQTVQTAFGVKEISEASEDFGALSLDSL
jgi:hypothetical protein